MIKPTDLSAEETQTSELSPLDQIRQSEAEVTRKIAAARETAVHNLEAARKEAARIVAQAREEGQQDGQVRYRAILQETEQEAKNLIDLAQEEVKELSKRGDKHMEKAVQQIVDMVIGSTRV
jgi:vacuolar-type H+-ATPase subunit H